MTPMRLRLRGTAGSGRSSLALRLVERAVEAGRRPLLVCFNRPLAEKLKRSAPPGAVVSTFYGLLDRFLQSRGHTQDFTKAEPKFGAGLGERVIGGTICDDWRFDTLIVDEG